jgi:uncharacterized protein YdiU (UPF0061 family)
VRIGSFQRLSYLRQPERLAQLLDHSVRHYYPALWTDGDNGRAAKFLGAVSEAVAETGAEWIAAGFVHGVLNTDNINITGESFDYGPWRFLPTYDPAFTAAYFDETGLYAFGRQPDVLAWNLTRLAEVLLPLGEHGGLEAALNQFWPAFQRHVWAAVLRRLGLGSLGVEQDSTLVQEVFNFLHETQMPFEQFFFDWRGGDGSRAMRSPAAEHYRAPAFEVLAGLLAAHPQAANANLDHPYFAREAPRTMLVDELEALWAPIAERDDWAPLYAALDEIEEMRQAYSAAS